MRTKYTILEMLFSNRWQWVRRWSKQYWVKDVELGTQWVKFSNEELDSLRVILGLNLMSGENRKVEDWRRR